MARNRTQRTSDTQHSIPLKRAEMSGPDPSRETLLDIAAKRGLINRVEEEQKEEVVVGRAAESLLWSMSLAMLHFTLDVLVHHQYAMAIEYNAIAFRFVQAFASSCHHSVRLKTFF